MRLVYDVERTDRYDRTLAYVYRSSDGMFLNLGLVRDGFAQVSTYPPNIAHVDDFTAAQRGARESSRGLWGDACAQPAPSPTAAAPVAGGDGGQRTSPYRNCTEAREDGAAPVHRGDPGYGSHLDGDDDGIGCE